MFIALNILFAIIVFAGIVGGLAWSVISAHTAPEPRVRVATARSHAPRRRAYGTWDSVNA